MLRSPSDAATKILRPARPTVHLEVVGGNRVCAARGHAVYTGNLHPL
ncbi:MAG TPA: hypothetical protein P5534_04140 [Candidatus Paceibacterota bacterium]|nr:hypothetical protein [Candidatus Paceibacterota bacterium]